MLPLVGSCSGRRSVGPTPQSSALGLIRAEASSVSMAPGSADLALLTGAGGGGGLLCQLKGGWTRRKQRGSGWQ